jgi:Predicted membrane protein (DUF2079)
MDALILARRTIRPYRSTAIAATTEPANEAVDPPRRRPTWPQAAQDRALAARAANAFFWAALVAGIFYRVIRYVDNRSLWLDESFLALNLLDRSSRELLDSLDYAQSAPPAFLLIENGVVEFLGDSERALRLFPLLSSLVALGVFAWVARVVLSRWGATIAIVLFATNDYLVYQASEVKPYSSDAGVAVVLLALFLHFERGPASLGRLVPLVVAGTLAPLLSFPSPLVLAGVGCGALLLLHRRGSRRDLIGAVAFMGVWVAVFGFVIALTSDTVQQISSQLFPGETSAGESLARVAELTWSVFVNPGGFDNGTNALAALVAAFGFFSFARAGPPWRVVALALPPGLAVIAAALDRYPIGGRYSLFLVPFLVLFVAAGIDALVRDSRRGLVLGGALAVVLVAPAVLTASEHVLSPPRGEHVRPLIETAADGWREGDTLYVSRNAQYALRYYTECRDCRESAGRWPWHTKLLRPHPAEGQLTPALGSVPPSVVIGTQGPGVDRAAADLARLPSRGRLWMLFSHVPTWEPLNQELLMRRSLDRRGRVLGEWRAGSASLALYDLG